MDLLKRIIKKVLGYKEIEFNVAGVTFKNGRRPRQSILRAIKYKDEPYSGPINITFKKGEFEGETTVEVWADKELIGYVPKAKKAEFEAKWTGKYMVESYKVLWSGKEAPFGFKIKVLFDK